MNAATLLLYVILILKSSTKTTKLIPHSLVFICVKFNMASELIKDGIAMTSHK